MEDFLETLEKILREDKQLLEGVFPYEQGNQIPPIRKYGELLKEEYREDGIYVKAYVPGDLYDASTTWIIISAYFASSRVLRKASIR